MPPDAPVVIVGAGPVGLAVSLGLARAGIRSIVLEKKRELSEHSKAVVVLPRTLEILRDWGVLPAFREIGEWIDEFTPVDASSNEPVLRLDFSILADSSATPGALVLPQDETERLLFEAARATGLVDVWFGHELTAFDADDSGARARVGGPEGDQLVETDLLCGCDGAHSVVREGLGLSLEGKTYDAHAILADVRIEDERDALPWPRGNLRQPGIRFAVRFRPNYWRLIVAAPGNTDEAPPDPGQIQRIVDELIAPGPAPVVWASAFKIHCRNAPHFRVGRVLLVGDAAHLNSPAGGQGMNAGIQDAYNLAWKIAAIRQGADAEILLKSYDEERFDAITRDVDVATDRLTRFAVLGPLWIRSVGLAALRLLFRIPKLARRAVESFGMLGFRQDMSELIDRTGGQLLPDVDLGDDLRLRDAIPARGGVVEVVQCGRKLFVGDRTFELSEAATRALSATPGPYLAVRPDHLVAYCGPSREDAEAMARRWQTA